MVLHIVMLMTSALIQDKACTIAETLADFAVLRWRAWNSSIIHLARARAAVADDTGFVLFRSQPPVKRP